MQKYFSNHSSCGNCSFSSGCEDYLGGDTNIDPNKTNDVSLNTLPTILYYTAQSTASNASISSQYIQQIGSLVALGSDAQLRNTFDGQWSNLYSAYYPMRISSLKSQQLIMHLITQELQNCHRL